MIEPRPDIVVRNEALAEAASIVEVALKNADARCSYPLAAIAIKVRGLAEVPHAALMHDTPWPIEEVLKRLIDVAEHSLDRHDCDRDGHELDRGATLAAKSILAALLAEPERARFDTWGIDDAGRYRPPSRARYHQISSVYDLAAGVLVAWDATYPADDRVAGTEIVKALGRAIELLRSALPPVLRNDGSPPEPPIPDEDGRPFYVDANRQLTREPPTPEEKASPDFWERQALFWREQTDNYRESNIRLIGERNRAQIDVEEAAHQSRPIPMFLTCPNTKCCERHVDRGSFATKPHHTHACQRCGLVWRPAKVPTVGVLHLEGFRNEPRVTDPLVASVVDAARKLSESTSEEGTITDEGRMTFEASEECVAALDAALERLDEAEVPEREPMW